MLQRTYVARLDNPLTPGTYAPLDILPCGPVGSKALPISAANGNAPAGWAAACGLGSFYELRSRVIVAARSGTAGFVPRFALGWQITVTPYTTTAVEVVAAQPNYVPLVGLSASLVGSGSNALINAGLTGLADPAYGPTIRLFNNVNTAGGLYLVTLLVFDSQDEDIKRP